MEIEIDFSVSSHFLRLLNNSMTDHKLSEQEINNTITDVALRMALYCVRNTIIEDYHAKGKLSDMEMMAFNKEVVNKIYTFLQVAGNPKFKNNNILTFNSLGTLPGMFHKPFGWDSPILDKGALQTLKLLEK